MVDGTLDDMLSCEPAVRSEEVECVLHLSFMLFIFSSPHLLPLPRGLLLLQGLACYPACSDLLACQASLPFSPRTSKEDWLFQLGVLTCICSRQGLRVLGLYQDEAEQLP